MHKLDKSNAATFLNMFERCTTEGVVVAPRGFEIRELDDFQIEVDPHCPFMTFRSRNYNLEYFKAEMLWKLGANKYDDSIKQHAKMWESVQNPDGTFNSNYGQYWFGEQRGFWSVVEELARDVDSRRAYIPMLAKEHMTPQTKDTVCTEGVGFRIRDGRLRMSVHMRSSDQVFGLGTDIPTFSFLYRLVYAALRVSYPSLLTSTIKITAMSSHVYSRHYEMLRRVIEDGVEGYTPVEMPWCESMAEVLYLVSTRGKYTSPPEDYWLSNWLIGRPFGEELKEIRRLASDFAVQAESPEVQS